MRSASMSWLFDMAGFNSKTLIGGYKAYRRYIKEMFSYNYKLIVLGGMTGSGKTELLSNLLKSGKQVIDLEGLANHKGSAFGSIGQKPQPTTEFFENLLFENLYHLDNNKPIWIEDESKAIGSVFIPDDFFNHMLNSQVIAIERPIATRIDRLTKEYTNCDPQLLIDAIHKITKRLGNDNAKFAMQKIQEGDFKKAVEISLKYYDKTYLYGLKNKKIEPIICSLENENIEDNINTVLEKVRNLF